ncbi:MAG: hypothetical protein JW720_13230 [Sedimentisphaerales bacterium]|nr:hypothetical protein [Sedimentisphaerales bacterium]
MKWTKAKIKEAQKGMKIYKHSQGDGWHYINDRFECWNNGKCFSIGDTSEGCILLLCQLWCRLNNVDFKDIYVRAYPNEDSDWLNNLADDYLQYTNIPQTLSRPVLIEDLHDVNYHSLADVLGDLSGEDVVVARGRVLKGR